MGRLIDADVLKGNILEKGEILIDENVEKCESMHDVLVYLLEKVQDEVSRQIDLQPTAFNIEEVVKELEDYVEQHKDYYQIGKDFLGYGACISVKKAIEIIRKGGVKNE